MNAAQYIEFEFWTVISLAEVYLELERISAMEFICEDS